MLVLSLSPVLGYIGAGAAAVIAAIIALIGLDRQPNVPQPHDPEAGIRWVTRKVRQPWKHRAATWLGLD